MIFAHCEVQEVVEEGQEAGCELNQRGEVSQGCEGGEWGVGGEVDHDQGGIQERQEQVGDVGDDMSGQPDSRCYQQ